MAVCLLGLLAVPAAAQAPTVKLTLDFTIQGQQSPFVLASEAGHFARAGVNVQVDRGYGSADAITKVASGAYDMAFADIGALIQFDGRQDKAKLIIVLQIYDVAPMVVLSLKKANISKPGDLAGNRVASPPASSTRAPLTTTSARFAAPSASAGARPSPWSKSCRSARRKSSPS